MKRIVLPAALLLLAGLAVVTGRLITGGSERPRPVEIVSEESDQHLKRQEWINAMHRAAPGTDWRAMDEQARQEMYEERLPQLQEAVRSGRLKGSPVESIADGYLTGQWLEKGSANQSGRVHCVDADFVNNRLYAAADGGQVYVGTLDGKEWKSLSDPYRIANIQFIRAFQTAGTTRVLAASDRVRMNYTDDMGTTWLTAAGLASYYTDYSLLRAVSQPNGTIWLLVYRANFHYLFRSKDHGATFTRLFRSAGSDKADLWTDRFGTDSLWLLDQNHVYSLQDSTAWAKSADININFAPGEIEQVQLAGSLIGGTTRLHAMYRLAKSSRFFASAPGAGWTYRGSIESGPFMSNSFGASVATPDLIGFGGIEAQYSTNGGATWTKTNGWGEYYGDVKNRLHADIPEIEFFKKPDGTELVFISTDGGTYFSDSQMITVLNVSLKDLNISQYYSTYTHRTKTDVIYAGSQDQGFQKSWQTGGGIVDFDQVISGDYGHIVSSDGGNSIWTDYPGFAMYYPEASTSNSMASLDWDGMGMKNSFWMPPLMADPYFPERVYVGGGTSDAGCHLWQLTHERGTVTSMEFPFDFSNGDQNARIASMAYSPINKDYRYVLNSNGKFFASTDRGTTWTMSTNRGPDSHYFYGNSIVPSPRDINTIWLAGSGYSGSPVWVSRDGGLNFVPMSKGMKNTLIFEMTCNTDGSMLFAASELGPWVYIAAKGQWYNLSGLTAPQQTWWSVDYVPALRTARFGTYGRGIWDFKIATFSGVEDIIAGAGLSVTAYPNPCGDWLNVRSPSLAEGKSTISLLTLDGRLVQTVRPAAAETARISMAGIPAGVYLVVVSDGVAREVVKVVRE